MSARILDLEALDTADDGRRLSVLYMQALKDREKILSGELTIRREIVQELVRLLANGVRSVSV